MIRRLMSVDVDALVQQKENDVAQSLVERARLKWFLRAAVALPLVSVYFSWKLALFLGVSAMLFFIVGHYLNFFHLREARRQLDNAVEAREASRRS
jgi:hypothetical protein